MSIVPASLNIDGNMGGKVSLSKVSELLLLGFSLVADLTFDLSFAPLADPLCFDLAAFTIS